MTNDAKLGLVVGVCLVVGVAAVFFRKELTEHRADPAEASAAGAVPSHGPSEPVPGRTAAACRGQQHTVKHGESLYSLAQQYYGDGHKYTEIYKVNRRVISNLDYVPPGTVLFIPDLERRDR